MSRRLPKVSFVVHSYNEADALRRLVTSSLPLVGQFHEWVIGDHRSDDHTAEVIEELRPVLDEHDIALKTFREERDLSPDFTFADIRTRTIKEASHPIVAMHDADFILGAKYPHLLRRAVNALCMNNSTYHGAAYSLPCIWDRLRTDARGRVIEHGRVWVHQIRARIFWRDAVHYEQTSAEGKWEKLVVSDPARSRRLPLTARRNGQLTRDTLISCNVKPPDRLALRDTMTLFMLDAMRGDIEGTWLDNFEAGKCRKQPAYRYQHRTVSGWKLNVPNLRLVSA